MHDEAAGKTDQDTRAHERKRLRRGDRPAWHREPDRKAGQRSDGSGSGCCHYPVAPQQLDWMPGLAWRSRVAVAARLSSVSQLRLQSAAVGLFGLKDGSRGHLGPPGRFISTIHEPATHRIGALAVIGVADYLPPTRSSYGTRKAIPACSRALMTLVPE